MLKIWLTFIRRVALNKQSEEVKLRLRSIVKTTDRLIAGGTTKTVPVGSDVYEARRVRAKLLLDEAAASFVPSAL